MKNKMNAAVIHNYGQLMPEIEQVSIPKMKSDDVLIKIKAASVNPIDLKTKDGKLKMLLKYQLPFIMGSDFAGTIIQTGTKVTKFKAGDAVYGRVSKNRIGTFAEYIAVNVNDIAIKPKNISYSEAASLPLVSLTSYQALHDVMNIQPDQKLLIQSGAGGIGTIAIQIAKYLGAYVATTTSKANFSLVQSLGADELIDYHTVEIQDRLSDFDYVFDTLGGKAINDEFKILKSGGKIVSISGLPDYKFAVQHQLSLWKKCLFKIATLNIQHLERKYNVDYNFLFMKPSGKELSLITRLVEHNIIHPIIDKTFDFNSLKDALAYQLTGKAHGKIIVEM